jgi:creatinine amidohydrolase
MSGDGPTLLRWETLSKRKFDELDRERCVVLVTCSPLEVHGPHLPLGADALEGQGLAQRALQHLPEPHRSRTFLQLPFVYAATDTVPQPGSLFFRPSTTVAVLTDLGRSLAAQGFRDIVVSNFHGSPRHFLAIEQACFSVASPTGAPSCTKRWGGCPVSTRKI